MPGESLPRMIASCNGGELVSGRKLMVNHEQCEGSDGWVDVTLGEAKSNLKRFGPGVRCTRALKCDSLTGQEVVGKLS